MIGGVMGLLVTVVISIFLGQRSSKMVNRKNTSREEVIQSLDLTADDAPIVSFQDYQYTVGLGAVGIKWT